MTIKITEPTPAPWRTDADFGHEVVLGAGDIMVADCCVLVNPKHGARDPGINAANARLIAAAPELLAALENIAQLQDDKCQHASAGILYPLLQIKVDIARAAIANAKGKCSDRD